MRQQGGGGDSHLLTYLHLGRRLINAETSRLSIRELTTADVPELASILGDPNVMRFSIRGVLSYGDTRKFVEWSTSLYAERGYGPWALVEKTSTDLVGFCGLSPELINGVEEIHIGYRLAHRFWNQGLATEAALQVLAHGFEMKSLESVVAVIEPEHIASLRVAEKAGFKDFVRARFHDRDVRIYRKTSTQWHAADA